MSSQPDVRSMTRDLLENGMDAEQVARYESAFRAAKVAAVAVLCARYGAGEGEVLEALIDSRNLNIEAQQLVARLETSAAFVGYVHSDLAF